MTDYDDTGLGAFDIYAPTTESDGADEAAEMLFTATNAAGTVSVSALLDGSIHTVELGAQVVDLTERELAGEILAVADVAATKGRAGQYELVSGLLRVQGQDEASARELLEQGIGLPTPEQARAAEAQLATRDVFDR